MPGAPARKHKYHRRQALKPLGGSWRPEAKPQPGIAGEGQARPALGAVITPRRSEQQQPLGMMMAAYHEGGHH